MEHPFTSKHDLTEQQLDSVYGGSQIVNLPANELENLKAEIKPAIGSTMAVGEEGGYFNSF